MTLTQSPIQREPMPRRAPEPAFDPSVWQKILQEVRRQHPGLNRVWFDQLLPRQITNGIVQVIVPTVAQLNFCQGQCQAPFTIAAQQVIGRLVSVTFHCESLAKGVLFNDSDQPLPLSPDYTFEQFVTGPCNQLAHAASIAV